MTSNLSPHEKTTVGWREWIALPELGIDAIKVKIDTGARSSSLHAFDIETFDRGGDPWVRFVVHPLQRDVNTTVQCEAPVLDFRHVRSSTGHMTHRPVIRAEIRLDNRPWPIDLTLAPRDEMGFRMLLGREAVRGTFVVDPGRSYIVSQPPVSKTPLKKRKRKKRRDQ
jgi:hypothetical protein